MQENSAWMCPKVIQKPGALYSIELRLQKEIPKLSGWPRNSEQLSLGQEPRGIEALRRRDSNPLLEAYETSSDPNQPTVIDK